MPGLWVDAAFHWSQHHPATVGNRTRRPARAAAELECGRDGIVQHVRSNSHELHSGTIYRQWGSARHFCLRRI